jgi:GNAT superfamily N-acetyltransferase
MTGSASPPHAIRAATRRDAAELARLLTALGHPTEAEAVAARWTAWAAAGNTALVAAAADGRLTGAATLQRMLVLHRPKPVGRITALVVDASVRGRGIGRALVAAAEAELAGSGCGLIEITSNARFAPAHAFYEHLGYERTSLRFAKALAPIR